MGVRMLQIASFYFVVGVVMGMGMSMTDHHELSPVHVHLNLIGWVSMAIGGLVYCRFPAATGLLGKLHFWMHNIGVPLMMGGLTALIFGATGFLLFVPIGGVLIVLGTIAFFANVVRNVRAD
ncbi:cytochrome-c oxidase [Paenibacillus antri]|uniref:Cytochrome-c oxidase n=1 Tax=Paenibacillus antri TaxID=2582848 RepID=A0A5R9G6C2_9BACL|nr:cytochrome-c oxidase [Paenibacillus antri]TLS51932.1 cytochrome-c oxidase [Paenibacillus antri]